MGTRVVQLSFYSADARRPAVGDLAGMLCGPGQAVSFGRGTAARLHAVLDDGWRARALVRACAQRGVHAMLAVTEDGSPALRTAFRADLTALASAWLSGGTKSVPPGFALDGARLRLWALASGRCDDTGYLLGLDPDAPNTHEPLCTALTRAGLPATVLAERAGGPALRVGGRRRLDRLAELVGEPPDGADRVAWPTVSRAR